ncbi:MAG: hypothetical protein HY097_05940 [Nitrospinae bacterium]|nr:hypothetical protein [Nitrospinota bacterium]MBI3812988.1 hypothetical protein [Nitrospinota bacterium]
MGKAKESSITANASEDQTTELINRLSKSVIQHQVCWQVFPAEDIVRDRIQKIGFNLELYGIHYHSAHTPYPGCDECVKVYKDLRDIAEWILPKEERKSWYEIEFFHGEIGYTGLRYFRPEITLRVEIRHREGYFDQIDECEIRCLTEMIEKLSMLGAKKEKWS